MFITLIHYIISFYMIFGWLVPYCNNLKFYIIFNIFIILHWISNNNNCIISKLEKKDKGVHTSKLFKKININIDSNSIFIDIINYSSIIIFILISYYRIQNMSCIY